MIEAGNAWGFSHSPPCVSRFYICVIFLEMTLHIYKNISKVFNLIFNEHPTTETLVMPENP